MASEITDNGTHKRDATCLTFGHVGSMTSSLNMVCDVQSVSCKEITVLPFPDEPSKELANTSAPLPGLRLDLNALDASSAVENNPFYPFKAVGQSKHVDASECGSTTGPMEETDPLKLWKEMKQNGFLSSSHGGIPVPKQRVRPPKKKKDDELKRRKDDVVKKKVEIVRREQENRYTKFSAPSGLLSGLNPGIINHVRNSKQVHSIIEAIVRSEKLDLQAQLKENVRSGKENCEKKRGLICDHGLEANQFDISSLPAIPSTMNYNGEVSGIGSVHYDFHQENLASPRMDMDCDDDVLTLKLSPAATSNLGIGISASADGSFANNEAINSMSLKAATVASQWLELLQQDIKGRLSALRRSKKRVRNAIQTELPYLLSTEFMCNHDSNPDMMRSSVSGSSRKGTPDVHVARWKSLFSQMDKALHEEGKHLERWLKQIQEMQLHCENGLKFIGLPHLDSSVGSSKSKNSEAAEREHAVLAAAASIYSTCNLILSS